MSGGSDSRPSTSTPAAARARILRRLRAVLAHRDPVPHPGPFGGWRPPPVDTASGAIPPATEETRSTTRDGTAVPGEGIPGSTPSSRGPVPAPSPLDSFEGAFVRAGGEVARVASLAEAASWMSTFAGDYASVTKGQGVPDAIAPTLPSAAPDRAARGISTSRGAVAETGTLILDSADGRRSQLLPPVHVVLLEEARIFDDLAGALAELRHDLPSALGLHSGPSKSADIGQVMVRGVHGPGRVIALVIRAS